MNSMSTTDTPVNTLGSQSPIEDYIENVGINHLEAIGAMFSAIEQLGSNSATAERLASHGRYVAAMLSNELDCLRSEMKNAGVVASAERDAYSVSRTPISNRDNHQ